MKKGKVLLKHKVEKLQENNKRLEWKSRDNNNFKNHLSNLVQRMTLIESVYNNNNVSNNRKKES